MGSLAKKTRLLFDVRDYRVGGRGGGGWDGGKWVGWGEVGGFRHEVLCTLYHSSCCSWLMKGFQLALEGEGRGIFSSPLHTL